MHDGDYETAAALYEELLARPLPDEMRARSLLGQGSALLRNQDYDEAVASFRRLLAMEPVQEEGHDATFLLGEALLGAGEPVSASQAYADYLAAGTTITPYVKLAQGDALQAGAIYTAALAAYTRALAQAPSRPFEADVWEKIAVTRAAQGDYAGAVEAYDAILAFAQQPTYRARIAHEAAEALLLSDQTEAAYERHAAVVETYPTQEHAYLSLVKLVEAGRPVDDFLRGQVDYYGEAYIRAVEALYRYIRAYPDTHSGDAHWYAALSFLELDNLDSAINELELLIETHPSSDRRGVAWLKLAEIYGDQGQTDRALSACQTFVDEAPGHPLAPEALWTAAELLERAGWTADAGEAYLACHEAYPASDHAVPALFRAGLQLYQTGHQSEAEAAWTTLADDYAEHSLRPAALMWLGKARLDQGEEEAAQEAFVAAREAAPGEYYGLRAAEIAATLGSEPTPAPEGEPQAEAGDRDAAEAWLASWLGLEDPDGIGQLAPELAADPRLRRGRELWRLGRFSEAKGELEALRADRYSDPLAQFQLALEYADLGLYRSSILCAWRLILLSPVSDTLDAPEFLVRLAYPSYYENLVEENASRTGLDVDLVYSLIRQESLFESLATSTASAQGLMQVIPPTGAEIAGELDWPDGYTRADLYLPYVSLRFGTYYLAKQRDRFDGRIDAALAAYNGGPFNAQRWLEGAGDDRDLFLEEITLSETHLYVRRVQEHLAVYEALARD